MRMLVAQAKCENMVIVTADEILKEISRRNSVVWEVVYLHSLAPAPLPL
jgi:hypothetical protein